MCSELENSDIRVAVGDYSVTERRRWRPPYQAGKTVDVHANTLQTNPGRFVPILVRSGRFGPISGVSRFGPVRAGRFGRI